MIGISTFYQGVASTSDQKRQEQACVPLSALSTTSTLMELAIAGISWSIYFFPTSIHVQQTLNTFLWVIMCCFAPGEHKVPVTTAVRFIKLMIQYKQPDVFVEHSRLMLEILSVSSSLFLQFSRNVEENLRRAILMYAPVFVRLWKAPRSGRQNTSSPWSMVSSLWSPPTEGVLERTSVAEVIV